MPVTIINNNFKHKAFKLSGYSPGIMENFNKQLFKKLWKIQMLNVYLNL